MTASRTIVLAPRLDVAKVWCLEHHVAPTGRNTRLCSTPDSIRGLNFEASDWLVVLPGTSKAVLLELGTYALPSAPNGEQVGRELSDWWLLDELWNAEDERMPFEHVFGAAT